MRHVAVRRGIGHPVILDGWPIEATSINCTLLHIYDQRVFKSSPKSVIPLFSKMPQLQRRFRINAKNIFITYPRCSLSKESAMAQLIDISLPSNKKFLRIALELHEDKTPHLHVLLQLEGRAQITNPRIFDLKSSTNSVCFHPNIQGARSCSDVKHYIEKGGDYLDWGTFQIDSRSSRDGRQDLNSVYADALNSSFADDALAIIRERDPRTYFLQFHNIRANADRIFSRKCDPYTSQWSYTTYSIGSGIQLWLQCNFEFTCAARPNSNNIITNKVGLHRPTSLVLEGPTRTGKTAWARSLGKHNYICGHLDFNPSVFSNDAVYNVIDDVAPAYLKMKHWKELIGCQRDWQSNCKYGKPVRITGGIPSIILCNSGQDSSYMEFLQKPDNKSLHDWTLLNAHFEFIDTPIFNNSANISATPAPEDGLQDGTASDN